jgi:hypothetical protein
LTTYQISAITTNSSPSHCQKLSFMGVYIS